MSHLVAKILLALLMFPVAVVLYCSVVIRWEQSWGYGSIFWPAGGIVWAFVAVYWTLLWRKSVRWTPFRLLVPAIAAIGGIFLAIIQWLTPFNAWERSDYVILLSILLPALWLIATILCWTETKAERVARLAASGLTSVTCPTCGYNLTGLTEARCPECGARFTLDELFATQRDSAAGDVE
jgi:hypothetical protein